ncbi:alpha/beta hydrolase [Gracilibacillus oryzae]|uniref:Alpha/beta hydrolase n=1 Tax=Gracilibacillus oryzae TaxID=1672701 RepID=A0A7C8L2V1_9BACI|nr:alpha/beta hydrolase [Gracilibacillus oryzae]KAB8131742.1 alpha/beta hydrolase [Gracilibacillus oryzae]
MQTSKWLAMSDQIPVYLRMWNQVKSPRAIVQIVHGMAEHIERYDDFATFLNSQNILVYGNDHRGHGRTGEKQNKMGYFCHEDGFDRAVRDLMEITECIQQKNPALPIFLIGHSMGSFFTRRYLTLHKERNVSGVVLIGTGYQPSSILKAGKALVKSISRIKEKTAPGQFMNKLTFNQYNKRTEKETEFDWLSTDRELVREYIKDPLCGFIPTNQFFYDLYEGIDKIQQKRAIAQINKQIPLLFLSGEDDPVTNYGEGMNSVARLYPSDDKELKIYPKMRHEILNEHEKEIVFRDILNWINKQIT